METTKASSSTVGEEIGHLPATEVAPRLLGDKPRGKRRRWRPLREGKIKYLLTLPVVVWIILVLEGPFLIALDRSLRFFNLSDPAQGGQWAGLAQYVRLMHDSAFFHSVATTLRFMVPAVFLEFVIGLALALFFYQLLRDRPLLSRFALTIFLIPLMASDAVTALTWKFMLQSDFGVLSYFLRGMGIGSQTSLLSDPDLVVPVLVLVDVWQWVPFVALIFFAGFMALPRAPVEAAECDGANFYQKVRYVMLPPLWPLVSIVLLFRTIDAFKVFDKVMILTGGGPGDRTDVLSLYAWRQGFQFWDQAYASAIVMFMFIVVIVAVELWFKLVYTRTSG